MPEGQGVDQQSKGLDTGSHAGYGWLKRDMEMMRMLSENLQDPRTLLPQTASGDDPLLRLQIGRAHV